MQAGILKNLMGVEGKEEEEIFLSFFGSTVSWPFSLYQRVTLTAKRHNPEDLLIWIDVTVTHRAFIWPQQFSWERGSLVPFMSSPLSWKSSLSKPWRGKKKKKHYSKTARTLCLFHRRLRGASLWKRSSCLWPAGTLLINVWGKGNSSLQ